MFPVSWQGSLVLTSRNESNNLTHLFFAVEQTADAAFNGRIQMGLWHNYNKRGYTEISDVPSSLTINVTIPTAVMIGVVSSRAGCASNKQTPAEFCVSWESSH